MTTGTSGSKSVQIYLSKENREATRSARNRVDKILDSISPNAQAASKRMLVVDHVRKSIAEALPRSGSYLTGSFPLKTYLPDSDIDITVVIGKEEATSWYIRLLESLTESAIENLDSARAVHSNEGVHIRSVSFINSEVKLVKCIVDNITVDVSVNKLDGVASVALLAEANRRIGRNDLFLRSVLLLKAWCTYVCLFSLYSSSHTIIITIIHNNNITHTYIYIDTMPVKLLWTNQF